MNVWRTQMTQDAAGEVWLVGVRGRLDQSLTPQLEAELNDLLNQGHARLIVDLSEVNYINSGGLRCLVSAWRQARQKNGNLVLYGLGPRLNEIFSMVGFDKVFQICLTAEAALAKLTGSG